VTTLAARIQSDLVGLTVWEAAAIGLLLIRWIGSHVAEGERRTPSNEFRSTRRN
jgi:hypothetical protein